MRSRIGTESTITTTIGPTELKSHWISLKTELHVLCSLPKSTAGTNPFECQNIMLSKINLCCPPPHVDLIPGWQTRNAYLHWRKPRLVIHRNRICILCVCHWRNFAAESSATDFSLCQAWSSRVCQYQPWSTMISPLKSGSIYAVLDNIFSGVVTNTSWSAIEVSFRWPF